MINKLIKSLWDGRRFSAANFVNLTPHTINIVAETTPGKFEQIAEILPSGTVARVETVDEEHPEQELFPLPVIIQKFGPVTGLPDQELLSDFTSDDNTENKLFIVSRVVLEALPVARLDVVAPDTGPTAARNDKGQVIGVTRFVGRITRPRQI